MHQVMTLEELSLFAGLRGDYILEPWLQKGELVLLFAKRGLAKTFIITKLINSLTTGSDFLKWQPKKIFTCIHFSGEMGRAISADRYEAVEKGCGATPQPGKARFLCFETMRNGKAWNLAEEADQKLFFAAAKGFDLIVLDNLNTLSMVRDKQDDEVKRWYRIQELLLQWRANNQTVIMVHHAGKSGAQNGTSAHENIMDSIVEIRKSELAFYPNGTSLEWHFQKSRSFFGADADPFHFAIQNQNGAAVFSWARMREMQIARYRQLAGSVRSEKHLCEIMGVSLYDLVKIKSEASGQVEIPEPSTTEPYFAEDTADELF